MNRVINEEAFSVSELGRRFKIGNVMIRKLIAEGTFKARKIGSGKGAKWIISARSVYRWLEGEDYPAAPLPTPIALAQPREIIALASLPSMNAEERAEIQERQESGELVITYINRMPALVPSDQAA